MMKLAPPRKSFLLAALFLGALLFLPPFLLSAWYREPLEQTLTEAAGLRTTIGSMAGSWFRPIEVRDVCVGRADDGMPLLTIDRVVWNRTLLGMIAPAEEQDLEVFGARIRVDAAGLAAWAQVSQDLVRAFSSQGKAALSGVVHVGKIRLRFHDASFATPEHGTILRCSGDASCDSLAQGEPILLQAQAEMAQGSQAQASLVLDAWTLSRTRMEWRVEGERIQASELNAFFPEAPPASGALESCSIAATKDVEGWTVEFSGNGETLTIPAIVPHALTGLSLRGRGRLEGRHLLDASVSAEAAQGSIKLWTMTPIALDTGEERETVRFDLSLQRPDWIIRRLGVSAEDASCEHVTLSGDVSGALRESWSGDVLASLGRLEWRLQADAKNVVVCGMRFDAVTSEGRVRDQLLNLDRVLLSSGGRLLQGSLRLSLRDPWSGSSLSLGTILPLSIPLTTFDPSGVLQFSGRIEASTENRGLSGTCHGEILRLQSVLPTGHRLDLKNVPVTALIDLDEHASRLRMRDVRAQGRDTDVNLKEVLIPLSSERSNVTLAGSARMPLLIGQRASGLLEADEICELALDGTAQLLFGDEANSHWRGQIQAQTGPVTFGPLHLDRLQVRLRSDDEAGVLSGEGTSGSGHVVLKGGRLPDGAWTTSVEATKVACTVDLKDARGEAMTFSGRASGTGVVSVSDSRIETSLAGVWESIRRSPVALTLPDLQVNATWSTREHLELESLLFRGAGLLFKQEAPPNENATLLTWRLPAELSELLSHSMMGSLYVVAGRSSGHMRRSKDTGSIQGPFELEAEEIRTSGRSYTDVALKGSGERGGLQLSRGQWRDGEGHGELIGFIPEGGWIDGLDVSCTLKDYPVRWSRVQDGAATSLGAARVVDRGTLTGTWQVRQENDDLSFRGEGSVANLLRVLVPAFGDAASFSLPLSAVAVDGVWNARKQTLTLNHARLQSAEAQASVNGLRVAPDGVACGDFSIRAQGDFLNAVLWDWPQVPVAAEGPIALDLESAPPSGGSDGRFSLALDRMWIAGFPISEVKGSGRHRDGSLDLTHGTVRLQELTLAFAEGTLALGSGKFRLRGDLAGSWPKAGLNSSSRSWDDGFWHPLLAGSRITADGPVSGTLALDGDLSKASTMEGFLRFRIPSFSAFPLPVLTAVADQIPAALRAALPTAQQELWSPLPLAFRPLASRGLRFEAAEVRMILDDGWLLPESTIVLSSSEGEFVARSDRRDPVRPIVSMETDLPERLRKRTPVGQTPLTPIQLRVRAEPGAFGGSDPKSMTVEILP